MFTNQYGVNSYELDESQSSDDDEQQIRNSKSLSYQPLSLNDQSNKDNDRYNNFNLIHFDHFNFMFVVVVEFGQEKKTTQFEV